MSSPMITVLMPVYNAEKYIGESIQSILNQNFTDFELLMVDDGSTDRSMEIARTFEDSRIRIISLPENMGLVNALNIGLAESQSKYIARSDADDISLPDRLSLQLNYMESNPQIGALGTGFDSLVENKSIKTGGRFAPNHETIRLRHLYQIQIIHGTSMFRKSVLNEHNLRFDGDFKHAEDYDFFDRLGDVSQIANLQVPLYLIRHHEHRVSNQFSDIQKVNSDRVKIRILGQIGINATSYDLELIKWLMYQNYDWFTYKAASDLAKLIRQLVFANNTSKYFEPEFLRYQFCSRFLHLCNFMAKQKPGIGQLLKSLDVLKFTDGPRLILSIRIKSL